MARGGRWTARALVFFVATVLSSAARAAQEPVTITQPENGAKVSIKSTVSGTALDSRATILVFVHPRSGAKWWVQPLATPSASDGSWQTTAQFGTGGSGVDESYDVVAMSVADSGQLRSGQGLTEEEFRALQQRHPHSLPVVVQRR